MLIQDMTREMSEDLLKRTHVGRPGCAQGSQPYVVPISFAYYREFLYSFASVGRRSSGCEPTRWSAYKLTRLSAAKNGKPS